MNFFLTSFAKYVVGDKKSHRSDGYFTPRDTSKLNSSRAGPESSKEENKGVSIKIYRSTPGKKDNLTEDEQFWWAYTSSILQILLHHARYAPQSQDHILGFYRKMIVKNLGPRPTAQHNQPVWRSFMTDDFTPIELSWNWGLTGELNDPVIRYSIEPIGPYAGKYGDPWNWMATLDMVRQFELKLPSFDSTIFHRLAPVLMRECHRMDNIQLRGPDSQSPSSMFLGLDINHNNDPTVKIYFVPFNYLTTPQRQRGLIIQEFLQPFTSEEKWDSLQSLLQFGLTSTEQHALDPFMVAFDCVPLAKSRVKIYFRSLETSFESVVRNLTLHDADLFKGNNALEQLERLWEKLFGEDPRTRYDKPLKHKKHETAGILYYYEVRPGSSRVVPKVYLPVKHYGISDLNTLNGLTQYFEGVSAKYEKWTKEYTTAVTQICSHRDLSDGIGLHTYVSCAVKQGSLDVTSYINPEIYHRGRHHGQT